MALNRANEALKENATPQKLVELSYVDILASIASAFIKYCSKYNLTQKMLADRLGISRVMISRIENGEWNLPVKKLANTMHFNKCFENQEFFLSSLEGK